MRIQHNISAMNSYRNFTANNSKLSKNLEKLSTGYKINRAGDDAAGLAISEKMRAQISGLTGAKKNATDGISLIQTAEGALTEVHDMLNRMYTLAEQSANGTYDDSLDRQQLQKEVDALKSEIDRIADSTNFNGLKLLDGSLETTKADAMSLAEADSVDFGDGVEIDAAAGEGAKSTFSIKMDKAFTEGDKLTLNFRVPTGNGDGYTKKAIELTYNATTETAASSLTNGVFKGDSIEDQMASIKRVLQNSTNNEMKGYFNEYEEDSFDITLSGDTLTFTAKNDGSTGKLHLHDAVVDDKGGAVTVATTAGAKMTAGTAAEQGVEKLVTGTDYYQAGDQLQFSFKLADGVTEATATVTITQEMVDMANSSQITNAIGDALMQASFEPKTGAVNAAFDVSNLKVGDVFNYTANKQIADSSKDEEGTLTLTAKDATALATTASYTLTDAQVKRAGGASFTDLTSNTKVTKAANTAATDGKAEVQAATITGLNAGDKVTVEGKLVDGRAFSVELEALKSGSTADANQFVLGADDTANANAIASALKAATTKVTIEGEEEPITGDKVFDGTAGTVSAKAFAATADAGVLSITNTTKGVAGTSGLTGQITNIGVKTTPAAVTAEQIQKGAEKTKAETTVGFDESAVEYGTAVTIGSGENAKTFELVQSGSDATTESGNVKVVMDSLEGKTGKDIADAFASAINDAVAADSDFAESIGNATATVDNETGKLTLTKAEAGASDAIAANVTYAESDGTTVDFNTKSNGLLKLKAGDTLKVNGQTYQFDTTARNLSGDNKLIKVTDFNDKAAISEAIKLAVEEEDATVSAKVNDDGTVTIRGKVVDGEFKKPEVDLAKEAGGLSLQIGDTSDSYNKLTVRVQDMHSDSLGIYEMDEENNMVVKEGKTINDVDISTQDGAAEAIDIIKNAVNMVSDVRGTLGALQNRLDHTINNIGVMVENIQSAESAIRDTDVAEEMMAYTKNNILNQSAQAMLAQANQLPQGVLQLLG